MASGLIEIQIFAFLKWQIHVLFMPTSDKVFIFDNILECIVILSVEGIFQVYKNPSKLTDCSMRLFIILMYFLVHGLNPLYNQSVVFWYGLGQVIGGHIEPRPMFEVATSCADKVLISANISWFKIYNACHWSLK